jgi:ATP-dependent DNA helicase PIF1
MTKRHVEAFDINLCDILVKEDLPFGGKTIVFGGDFRQTLSVV